MRSENVSHRLPLPRPWALFMSNLNIVLSAIGFPSNDSLHSIHASREKCATEGCKEATTTEKQLRSAPSWVSVLTRCDWQVEKWIFYESATLSLIHGLHNFQAWTWKLLARENKRKSEFIFGAMTNGFGPGVKFSRSRLVLRHRDSMRVWLWFFCQSIVLNLLFDFFAFQISAHSSEKLFFFAFFFFSRRSEAENSFQHPTSRIFRNWLRREDRLGGEVIIKTKKTPQTHEIFSAFIFMLENLPEFAGLGTRTEC